MVKVAVNMNEKGDENEDTHVRIDNEHLRAEQLFEHKTVL